jgi:hypothetical protein
LLEANGCSTGCNPPTIAGEQTVAAQFPHSALYGVLPSLLAISFNPKRKLQDRQLRRVEDKDLGEDRPFHDLVLVSGRE